MKRTVIRDYEIIEISERFEILSLLGKGTYGKVYKVKERMGKQEEKEREYALKLTPYEILMKHVSMREVSILSEINHPNIVKIHEIFIGYYKGTKVIGIRMDKYCRHIYDHYVKMDDLDEEEITKHTLQIIDGLNYINGMGYIHGDLNYLNIMIDDEDNVKIIDFGFVRKVYRRYRNIVPPTVWCRPIELFGSSESKNLKTIDTWSLGCILLFMITNHMLIQSNSKEKDENKEYIEAIITILGRPSVTMIKSMGLKISNEIKKTIPLMEICKYKSVNIKELLNIFKQTIQYNPSKRPTIKKITQSEWFKKAGYKLTKPSERQEVVERMELNDEIIKELLSLVKMNRTSDEVLFITAHNISKVLEQMKKRRHSVINITKIMFMMSLSIVEVGTILKQDVEAAMDIEIDEIKRLHDEICINLEYRFDPMTMYSEIESIPVRKRGCYRLLNFIMIRNKETNREQENMKSMIGKIVVEVKDEESREELKNIVEGYIRVTRKIKTNKWMKDEMVYIYSRDFGLNKEMKWLQNIDYMQQLEKWFNL